REPAAELGHRSDHRHRLRRRHAIPGERGRERAEGKELAEAALQENTADQAARQQPQRVAGGTSSQAFDGNGGAFLACRAIEPGCLVYRISDNARERRRVRSRTVERRKQGREREPDWLYKKHLRSAGGSMADRPTKTAPYGSWRSPITSDLIVAQSIALS